MSVLFLKVINMSITASWLILAVVIARVVLKKAPKWITCLLWALVAIRLVFPFSFESKLSLVPSSETIPMDIETSQAPSINSGITILNESINPIIEESFAPSVESSANPLQIVIPIASVIWALGVLLFLIYALISYLRLKKSVSASVPIENQIMVCDDIDTPFILGILKPIIYIPSSMNGGILEHVIRHEKAHLKRHDHLWKPLGYLLLSVYWFNPLCWIAYVLLCRDIEMACDECVIRGMDKESIALYSQALLDCSFPRRRIAACPLAFGEVGVKDRVKSILNYKKPAFWIILIATLIGIALAVSLMTNPASKKKEGMDSQTNGETQMENSETTGIANPWTDWNSLAEAENAVGFSFGLPETITDSYKAESFRTMNGELIEVTYRDDDYEVFVRKAKSNSVLGEDISGDFNNYEKVNQRNRFGATTTHYYFENGGAMKTLINYEGYSWSLVAPKGYWGDSFVDFYYGVLGQHIQVSEDVVSEMVVSTQMTDPPQEIIVDENQYKEVIEKIESYKISESDEEIGNGWQYRILMKSDVMESDMELTFMDDKVYLVKGGLARTYTLEGYDKWDFYHLFGVENGADVYIGALRTYQKKPDGTWECEGYSYKYRLEITGRMHSAAKDSTFVYLSNMEEITFDQAWKAAGLSSNSEDYFTPEEAVLVDWS